MAEIVEMMRRSMGRTFDEHRQIASGTHAKTHGVVTGRFTVDDDLPPEWPSRHNREVTSGRAGLASRRCASPFLRPHVPLRCDGDGASGGIR